MKMIEKMGKDEGYCRISGRETEVSGSKMARASLERFKKSIIEKT